MTDAYSVPKDIELVNFSPSLIKSSIRTQKYWEFIP